MRYVAIVIQLTAAGTPTLTASPTPMTLEQCTRELARVRTSFEASAAVTIALGCVVPEVVGQLRSVLK